MDIRNKYGRRTVEEDPIEIEPIDDKTREFLTDILDATDDGGIVTLTFSQESVSVGVSRHNKSLGTIIDKRHCGHDLPQSIIRAVRHLSYGVDKS